MTIDLLRDPLDRVAREASTAEVETALRGVDSWDEETVRAADYLLRQRVVGLLRERSSPDQLLEEADMILRFLDPALKPPLDGQDDAYGKWVGYARLLEGRAKALEFRRPDAVRRMAHVEAILGKLRAERRVTQTHLAEALGLKASNLTRILQAMEAVDFVERELEGSAKWVLLGRDAPKAVDGSDAPPPGRAYRPLMDLAGVL